MHFLTVELIEHSHRHMKGMNDAKKSGDYMITLSPD